MRVLFIDDDMTILNTVVRALRDEGHEIFLTTDPAVAADIVHLEKIDVIVSDHLMPHLLGTDLLRAMKSSGCVQILMSGVVDEEVVQRGIDEGIVDKCIRKPFAPSTLRRVLREASAY